MLAWVVPAAYNAESHHTLRSNLSFQGEGGKVRNRRTAAARRQAEAFLERPLFGDKAAVLKRLGYWRSARRAYIDTASPARRRGGVRSEPRRCRDWRASPWLPRCRRR
jgi:hypothetical protein